VLERRVLAATLITLPIKMLRGLRQLAFASTAAALLAGCGEEQSRIAATTSPRPTTAPSGPAGREQEEARLVVLESLPATPRYIEGSVSFLRVEQTSTGEVIVDGPMTDGMQVRGREPLFSRALEPGEYHVVSYQRPCVGNCGSLDPPSDRCEATVRLNPGTLTATVVLGQEGGCSVRED
jgi:hypothetical protein